MRVHYAALDAAGDVVGVENSADAAVELLREQLPGATIAVEDFEPEASSNPVSASSMPDLAMRRCKIARVHESAADMSLAEAHRLLLPFFQGLIKRGAPVHAYDTPRSMSSAWIGQNYKTGKGDPRGAAEVMGVTLVPAAHPRLAAIGEGPYALLRGDDQQPEGMSMIRRWKSELPSGVDKKFTLCAGSSQNCRDSCLVFTGQNASELYNTYRKVAQTMALLNEPAAFCRMLVDSLEHWLDSKAIASGAIEPFVRMNVLSDIPWEIVAPWIFERFANVQFYDYTKVPGREVPDNYDLTFSLSGEDANAAWAHEEIDQRGRRIAVVFIGHKRRGGEWRPYKLKGQRLLKGIPLPETFWDLPVVDGDISDVRPRDDAPVCVGLRWKTPSGKRAGVTTELANNAFVVPVYVFSQRRPSQYRRRGRGSAESWEGEEPNPNDDDDLWLVCPVTPRHQPIEHTIAQPIS